METFFPRKPSNMGMIRSTCEEGCLSVYPWFIVFVYFRVKGSANILASAERGQMEKEADEVMHSLFIFMEDKWVSCFSSPSWILIYIINYWFIYLFIGGICIKMEIRRFNVYCAHISFMCCVHTNTNSLTPTHTHILTHLCSYSQNTHNYTHTYNHTHIYMYVHTHIHMHICTYTMPHHTNVMFF